MVNFVNSVYGKPIFILHFLFKSFLNELYTPEIAVQDVPKRDVFAKFSLLGNTSFQIWKKLQKIICW